MFTSLKDRIIKYEIGLNKKIQYYNKNKNTIPIDSIKEEVDKYFEDDLPDTS